MPANATTENLIVREDDESLDNLRWKLFQWVTDLNVETIETIKESVDTNYVQIVLFTLKFLLTVFVLYSLHFEIILRHLINFDSRISCETAQSDYKC